MAIKEWKSVNDDVVRNAEEISSEIALDSENKTAIIGTIENLPFKKGSFTHDCGGDIGKVSVVYCIFQADNENDYKRLANEGVLNCQADNDTNTIMVNDCIVSNKRNLEMVQSIGHELNHLLQYSKGFKKNDILYKIMSDVIMDGGISKKEKLPAYLLYYTFKHEVDSFATQFYFYLKENKIDYKKKFDEILNKYRPYSSAKFLYEKYRKLVGDKDVEIGIKLLGLSNRQFKNRVEYGFNKLYSKLRNVFHRYAVETRRSGLVLEGIMGRFVSLYSRYGIFEEEMEPMFVF